VGLDLLFAGRGVKGQMNLDGDGQQNWTETDTRSGRWRPTELDG
jgi:hypothetical protein